MADTDNEKKPRSTARAVATAAPVAAPAAVTADEVAQLRELTSSLIEAVGAMKAENEQRGLLNGLVDDVRAATRSMRLGEVPAPQPAPRSGPVPDRTDCDCNDCGCGPCDCVSAKCCMFEINVTHVKVLEMQSIFEPSDSGFLPFGQMEIRMFVSIDGVGTVIPNMFSTLSLFKKVGEKCMWTPACGKVGTVTVCKGKSTPFVLNVDAIEQDNKSLIELFNLRDEHGSNSVVMDLDCCVTTPITKEVEVELNHYGKGGGAIAVRVVAKKLCC